MQQYSENFVVYRHDGDKDGVVKPGALLRYAQQCATDHSTAVGITDSVYSETKTAYLLAKLALHIEKEIRIDEVLSVVTIPEKMKRAVNKRITLIYNEKGEQCAILDSRWVLVDTQKRIILRSHPNCFEENWAENVPQELPLKIEKPHQKMLEHIGECTASYSRCDMNGHMNNTYYADIVCDLLPVETWKKYKVTDLLLFYHKEILLGESCDLYRFQKDEYHWYLCGTRSGKCCFEANVILCDRNPFLL